MDYNDENKNYRVTFNYMLEKYDYWTESEKYHVAYPLIKKILKEVRDYGCKNVYWFFTPDVEITWQSNDKDQEILFQKIRDVMTKHTVFNYKEMTPKDGKFGDWFANSELESRWGEKRYARCTELAEEFYDYEDTMFMKKSKGKIEQVKRSIHGICNPLGLNYRQEAYICFSRGLFCLLRTMRFSQERAQWIYTKIFRQKY